MNWEKDGEVPTLKIFHRAKIEIFGPGPLFAPSESLGRPTSIQISSTQCIWVVRIHITCLGPLTDPYDTPGPVLAPKGPFEGPRGTWRARRVQIWSQLLLIGLTGLESWLPDTLTWYLASSGPPGPPKGPLWPQKGPKWGQNWKFSQTNRVTYQNLKRWRWRNLRGRYGVEEKLTARDDGMSIFDHFLVLACLVIGNLLLDPRRQRLRWGHT